MKAKNRYYYEFGKRVTRLRKECNLTQIELAKKLGISQQLVAQYESGERRVQLDRLDKLASVLGVSVNNILATDSKNKPGPKSKLYQKIDQVKNLPAKKQKFVSEFLDTVLETTD